MKQAFAHAALVTAALMLSGMQVAKAQVPAQTLRSISIPDKVNTPIGTLEFFDGAPIGNTVKTVYDNLDRSRALGVYLDNVGAVSDGALRVATEDSQFPARVETGCFMAQTPTGRFVCLPT